MAIGAMEDRRAPTLFQPGNSRQFIGDAHGEDQPVRCLTAFAVDLDYKIAEGAFGIGHPALSPIYGRVTFNLTARLGDNFTRRLAILAEKTVGMAGETVSPFTGIHHQNVFLARPSCRAAERPA